MVSGWSEIGYGAYYTVLHYINSIDFRLVCWGMEDCLYYFDCESSLYVYRFCFTPQTERKTTFRACFISDESAGPDGIAGTSKM